MPDIFVEEHKHKKGEPKINVHTHLEHSSGTYSEEKTKLSAEHHIEGPEAKVHVFSSFCRNPSDIFFKNQQPNEKVLLFLRKHMITNLRWISLSILLILAPIFVVPLLVFFDVGLITLPIRFTVIFLGFYYLVVSAYIYVHFITWYFNISFVTDIRVVDIDFSNLIYKNIAATKLSLVQDVSFDQIGVIPTFFDYGDVLVQTAGTMENFDFESSPQPENVVHIIHDLIGKHGTV
ncbi:MAG: hypothetical protein COU25_03515 [Candidatus Levybacteria bacterium CG10_big_fil_rev_8_21_14_0_10_35_13]|nr:MAG: hypothetical protein COU25_03515 [Candidatus Levybacteria bacterium CG10_big_fil_rev_8_21_14_0_10_35_13]